MRTISLARVMFVDPMQVIGTEGIDLEGATIDELGVRGTIRDVDTREAGVTEIFVPMARVQVIYGYREWPPA